MKKLPILVIIAIRLQTDTVSAWYAACLACQPGVLLNSAQEGHRTRDGMETCATCAVLHCSMYHKNEIDHLQAGCFHKCWLMILLGLDHWQNSVAIKEIPHSYRQSQQVWPQNHLITSPATAYTQCQALSCRSTVNEGCGAGDDSEV